MAMNGKNGKLSGYYVFNLLFKDYLFFRPNEIQFDGTHHKITGIQANSAKLPKGTDMAVLSSLAQGIVECMQFAETNPKLMRKLSNIDPSIYSLIRNEDLTGITLIDLASQHLLMIQDVTETMPEFILSTLGNTKIIGVMADPRLSKALPEFDVLIEELIHTLLKFTDDDTDDLRVQQIGMRNLDT